MQRIFCNGVVLFWVLLLVLPSRSNVVLVEHSTYVLGQSRHWHGTPWTKSFKLVLFFRGNTTCTALDPALEQTPHLISIVYCCSPGAQHVHPWLVLALLTFPRGTQCFFTMILFSYSFLPYPMHIHEVHLYVHVLLFKLCQLPFLMLNLYDFALLNAFFFFDFALLDA